MRISVTLFFVLSAGLAVAPAARADQEASNVAHVVADPHGRCYAKSVPRHIYDPADQPRQQGHTEIYSVGPGQDELVARHDWFAQQLFVRCRAGAEPLVVRIGPWQRGHDPAADHLALAFYRGGALLKRYSTLDIAGSDKAPTGSISAYRNVSASVSHYTVFAAPPQLTRITDQAGALFREDWVVTATTVDGREMTFDMATGELR